MTPTRTRRLATVGAALLLGSLTLAGCSNSSDDTATTPNSSPTVSASPTGTTSTLCADATATKASLQGIVDVNVLKDGTNALRSNFATFRSDAETLIASAQTQFSTQTDALRTSISGLQTAIDNLKDSPSVAEVAALAPALASIRSTTQTLLDAVDDAC